MSGSDQAEPRNSEKKGRDDGKGTNVSGKNKPSSRPGDVGRALRSVYDDTLREDIPLDLKDLLGRLG